VKVYSTCDRPLKAEIFERLHISYSHNWWI